MRFFNRAGCKERFADKVVEKFPDNFEILISPFFGTGAIEFSYLGKIPYIIANDLDNNIYNLYYQILNNFGKLFDLIEMTPYCEAILNKKANSELEQAVLFLCSSNFTMMASGFTLKLGNQKIDGRKYC